MVSSTQWTLSLVKSKSGTALPSGGAARAAKGNPQAKAGFTSVNSKAPYLICHFRLAGARIFFPKTQSAEKSVFIFAALNSLRQPSKRCTLPPPSTT